MSYQVLARKYRPKTFAEMVGQEHVLRALINALDNQRLHHAYLFTGTRGTGKTTLARLLAKCLNCEAGISSKPCETCVACQEINAGRFVDLIEVDAASRTKVEDTRELLENVQYAPTRGRYKIYLIDEVHMLSGHSFNALLKTLEEPPPHVKFLLATTDPQRLPITILSRCLQFNLKNLPIEKIQAQLENILQKEQLAYEPTALAPLARAANGSLRDALSLLDQAIAYSNNHVTAADVRAMLGTIEHDKIWLLLEAIAERDSHKAFAQIKQLAEQTADFNYVLEELITLLHHIALAQVLPESIDQQFEQPEKILQLAQQFTAEDVQLFYQISLIGRRDLPLAPSSRVGFEMVILRLLAFHPAGLNEAAEDKSSAVNISSNKNASTIMQPANKPATVGAPATAINAGNGGEWAKLISQLNLAGFTLALANNCVLKSLQTDSIHLELDPAQSALRNPKQEARLNEALNTHFGRPIKLQLTLGQAHLATPARNTQQQQTAQIQAATAAIQEDANVQSILKTFNAKIDLNSIQPKNPAMLSDTDN